MTETDANPVLPSWARLEKPEINQYEIDADKAYPAMLAELGVTEPDQYWLEVAYQFAKLDLQRYLMLNGRSPWGLRIMIRTADKSKWRIENYPEGNGVNAADKRQLNTAGEIIVESARDIYKRMRGFIPN